jgi:pimeloyl-ACP methyl ester carboxylesterase
MERLSSQFHCIAVDLPGLGRSAPAPHGFRDLAALAASLNDIRIECKIDKWHVVGHDAGCAIAVHYAHRFQNHVGRLALLSPSMFPDLKPFYLFEVLRRPVIGELMAPLVNLLFWNVAMRWAMAGNQDRYKMARDFQTPFLGLRGSWRLMSLLRWGDPAELLASIPAFLPGILAPTLIFHGSRDPAVPEAFARRASDLIPDSELLFLNCGHFLPLHEPNGIAQELSRFFNRGENTTDQTMVAAAGDHLRL